MTPAHPRVIEGSRGPYTWLAGLAEYLPAGTRPAIVGTPSPERWCRTSDWSVTRVTRWALVLSAHVELEHAMTLLASGGGIGYLLKSRVVDVEEFVDALGRIARGDSVVDPELVKELVSARRRSDPLAALSAREREVLALMAEGRSNAGIAAQLWVTEGTVEKHVRCATRDHEGGAPDAVLRGLADALEVRL